jgi:glycosyltransferase involved in cell wall biosynthesis
MKILFFIDTLGSGGKERRMVELIKALNTVPEVDVEIIVMSSDIHYQEILDMDIKIHSLIRKTRKDIFVFYRLFKICKTSSPDLLHCWDSMTAIYAAPICSILGIKLINGMIIDAPTKQNIFNKDWLRAKITFPFSSIIIGNSQAGLNSYNAPLKKSRIIYNGFNFNRLNGLKDANQQKKELNVSSLFVIGMVASFSIKKDYKTFFEAANLLLNKGIDITFLVIGSNTDSDESQFLAGKLHKEQFRFLGKRNDIESIVNIMDICILATFTEGISNSILEYMSLGKPVIATSGGGTNEIVIDNKTGFLCEVSNPADLAAKIEILLNNFELRKTFGLNGKRRIHDAFSISSMTSKYILAYSSINKKG